MELENSFRVLGVPIHAEIRDVKSAFKQLALQYHPDRNDSPEAAEMFNSIIEAYNVIMSSYGIRGFSEPSRAYEEVLNRRRGNLAFSLMKEEKEEFHHALAIDFEGEVRRRFNPNVPAGTFCKVGKRWFQIDTQAHSSFSFLNVRSGNRENLIEWFKSSEGADNWRPMKWEDFWTYVRRYASHAAKQQTSSKT